MILFVHQNVTFILPDRPEDTIIDGDIDDVLTQPSLNSWLDTEEKNVLMEKVCK